MVVKISFFKPKNNFWLDLTQIIFRVSFLVFLILLIIDYFFPGFVTNWFNPVWLLIISLITGIILIAKD